MTKKMNHEDTDGLICKECNTPVIDAGHEVGYHVHEYIAEWYCPTCDDILHDRGIKWVASLKEFKAT